MDFKVTVYFMEFLEWFCLYAKTTFSRICIVLSHFIKNYTSQFTKKIINTELYILYFL